MAFEFNSVDGEQFESLSLNERRIALIKRRIVHLNELLRFALEGCLFEEAIIREIVQYTKCFNQELYHLYDPETIDLNGRRYQKAYMQCDKKDAGPRYYLYWSIIKEKRFTLSGAEQSPQKRFVFRKLRRPTSNARKQNKMKGIHPVVSQKMLEHDAAFDKLDKCISAAATAYGDKQRIIKIIRESIRTLELAKLAELQQRDERFNSQLE